MEKRKLGISDINLSVLGMGCWVYGEGDYWGHQNQKDVEQVVHKALDHGINYFDTAEAYNNGASEKSLGMALKGRRDEAIIGTKVSPSNSEPSKLRQHCEESLKRLNTDYLDIYMIHWPINSRSIKHFTDNKELILSPPSVEDACETLKELKKEGKIRIIGVSNFGIEQMKELKEIGINVVANELPYNLLSRAIEKDILPYCKKNGIGVIAYMGLQQGLLAGIYPTPESVPPMQARSRHFHYKRGKGASRHNENGAEKEVFWALKEISKVVNELGIHIVQLSLAWAMAKNGITSTLVGSRNLDELKLNIQAASYKLNENVINRLDNITKKVLLKLGSNPDYYENSKNSRIK